MDHVSAQVRSRMMSRIQGRGNQETEVELAKLFRQHHIKGWRRHQPMFGKPDFIFSKYRLAVFVDGCFWHGCPKHGRMPKSKRTYWREKLARNVRRDQLVTQTLRRNGWRVVRIWKCVLHSKPQSCLKLVSRTLARQES